MMRTTWRRAALGLAAAILVLSPGCVTTREVQDIVASSNAALEGRSILGETAELRGPGKPVQEDRELIARIDQFIAENPDQARVNNALLVRKALLLLSAGRYNQSAAAFQSCDRQSLGNSRDRALYDVHATLIWWWRVARLDSGGPGDGAYEPRLEELTGTVDGLSASAIRQYLALIRVVMHRQYAELGSTTEEGARRLAVGLGQYASEFDQRAREHVKALAAPVPHIEDDAGYERWLTALRGIPVDSLRGYAAVGPVYRDYADTFERLTLREPTETDWPRNCVWMMSLSAE